MNTVTYNTSDRRISFRLDKITYIIKDLDSKTLYVFFDNGTNITIINDKEVEDVVLQYWENH